MSTHYLALDIGSTTVVAIVIDLDRDGQIGFSDFFLFASSFGTILPAP